MWSVLSWQCRHCPPLFYVGGCFVCIHVCAPCTLLVSLKGRPGRVPNPLKLKLQITKPPCGCWELLFWHQLLPSKKIPTYQTAEPRREHPGAMVVFCKEWEMQASVRVCRLQAPVPAAVRCELLCVSQMFGYVWKRRVRLVHQTSCFCPWDRRRAVVIQKGVW